MAENDTPAPAKHNGYDPDLVKELVGRIENVHGDLASEKGSYMERCKVLRGDIAEIYDEAKAKGIPKKALKKVIKIRELERKAEAEREDGDVTDDIDLIRHALGDLADLPLGQSALDAAA